MRPCIQRRLSVPLALLFATSAALRADIKLPAPGPPQADALSVRVLRGGGVMIPLRAHYGGRGTISFAIEERPRHGALSDLRLLGDNRATVTYQNDGADSVATDRFTYLVKSSDHVSSPAEVTIFIEEPPARMQVPDRIEFETILAGESGTLPLRITNAGGGVLEGRLTVSAPWVLKQSNYRVGAGATESIGVTFRPDEGRSFVGQITLLGSDGTQNLVSLEGVARSPLALEPGELQISLPKTPNERRMGVFALTNQTEHQLPLQFACSSKLRPVDGLVLEPRETKKIEIEIVAGRTVPIHEQVAIIGPGFRQFLPIEAPAEPTKLAESGKPVALEVQPAVPPQKPLPAATSPTIAPSRPTVIPTTTPEPQSFVSVRAERVDSARWDLRWPQPREQGAKYLIEERFLALDGGGELQITWRPLPAPEISSSGDRVIARLSQLAPRQLHMVRVTALRPDGTELWESPLVPLAPPSTTSRGRYGWLLLAGGSALALLLFLRHRTGA